MQTDSGQIIQQPLLREIPPHRWHTPALDAPYPRNPRQRNRLATPRPIRRCPGNRARRLDIAGSQAVGAVIDHLRIAPVLIVLPAVHALLAAPTAAGIVGLNRMKRRLAGKNYGTAVGDLSRFWNLVDDSSTPDGFRGACELEDSRDIFFRCRIGDPGIQSPVVANGTHQTLILDGLHRNLMCEIEEAFEAEAEPGLFAGHRFSAPLITRCNISGDPLGSITDEIRSRHFVDQQGVGLVITGATPSAEAGSYPILELEQSGVSVRREGGSIRSRDIYRRFGKEA